MRHRHLGFNLLELLVVVAISVILLTLALPSLGSQLERTRLASTHNQLAAAFSHARLLALTERRQSVVCPSANGAACRDDGIWESGWITFVDRDADGVRDVEEAISRADSPAGDSLRIRSSSYRSRVLYRSNGMARGANLTLRLCGSDGKPRTGMVVNNGGRVRTATPTEISALPDC